MKTLRDLGSKIEQYAAKTWVLVSVGALAYIVRAFPYIHHPQLYADDGGTWLADGYNHGLQSLATPLNGFFHLPERIFGFIVAHTALQQAAFIFNSFAFLFFVMALYYLLSERVKLFNTTYERVFLLLCFCLIANVDEFFFNFSNAIFLLGIVGVLTSVAKAHTNKAVRVIERIVYALTCFTLPFAWFYLLINLNERIRHKITNNFFLYFSIAGTITQLICYLTSHVDRSAVTVHSLFSRYTILEIYNQIIIPAVRFARLDTPILAGRYAYVVVFLTFMTVLGLGIFTLKHSSKNTRYLLFFLAAMTAASLKSPTIASTSAIEAIKFMSITSGGDRYFIYGIIAVNIIMATTTYYILAKKARYIFLAIFILFGLATSIEYHSFLVQKNFLDLRSIYHADVTKLQTNQTKTVVIPINPGGTWSIILEK